MVLNSEVVFSARNCPGCSCPPLRLHHMMGLPSHAAQALDCMSRHSIGYNEACALLRSQVGQEACDRQTAADATTHG